MSFFKVHDRPDAETLMSDSELGGPAIIDDIWTDVEGLELWADGVVAVGNTALRRTAVRSASATASNGDHIPSDTTAGGFPIIAPVAADGAIFAVKHIVQGGSAVVTITCAGSDKFNRIGGGTSATLPLASQGALFIGSPGIWTVISDDLPLTQLDGRYIPAWQDWTPKLVVNDANASNGYNPSATAGVNPTMGGGYIAVGRYIQFGKTVIARATIAFGASGVAAGTGAYRMTIPVPCTAAANSASNRAIIGHGQIYDDSTAQATFGLGPASYRGIDLHTAETIATDVVGLINAGGLPITNFQGGGFTVTNHTDSFALDESSALSANTKAIRTGTTTAASGNTFTDAGANFGTDVLGQRVALGTYDGIILRRVSSTQLDVGFAHGLTSPQTYTIYRDEVTALSHVVGTILDQMAKLTSENVLVDVANSSPWVWAANDRIIVELIYEAA